MMLDLESRFPRAFFEGPTLQVARQVLGSVLVHRTADGVTAGRIVEAEGYLGPLDRGAHSFEGKATSRTAAMFGEKGRAYVFLIYGMYWCFNVVSGAVGKPQAVLVRALEPVVGIDLMRKRLGAADAPAWQLCRGPGKLCKAMDITKACYGADLLGDSLFIVPQKRRQGELVMTSRRINIDYAGSYVSKPWRFYIGGNPCVTRTPRRLE